MSFTIKTPVFVRDYDGMIASEAPLVSGLLEINERYRGGERRGKSSSIPVQELTNRTYIGL